MDKLIAFVALAGLFVFLGVVVFFVSRVGEFFETGTLENVDLLIIASVGVAMAAYDFIRHFAKSKD